MPLSNLNEPLYRQVYHRLRNAILDGTFSAGQKLPSTREMAEELGVSRIVALMAYEQLLSEGFASGRVGSGTYVSRAVEVRPPGTPRHSPRVTLSRFGKAATNAWPRIHLPSQAPRPQAYDFALGISDVEMFPFQAWRRILQRCVRRTGVAQLDYAPPGGN